jgi:hypothetical protein
MLVSRPGLGLGLDRPGLGLGLRCPGLDNISARKSIAKLDCVGSVYSTDATIAFIICGCRAH